MSADEVNRFSGRFRRYIQFGRGVGNLAAKAATRKVRGLTRLSDDRNLQMAPHVAGVLGELKGPVMKIAQMLATIPDVLPSSYFEEFVKLQTHAPAMGEGFVRRRMRSELGQDWMKHFHEFDLFAHRSASLGQVHCASLKSGRRVVCKLQYPEMASAVEADVFQLRAALRLGQGMLGNFDVSLVSEEIAARLREELDYVREAKLMRVFHRALRNTVSVRIPEPVDPLVTRRLLVMDELRGQPILSLQSAPEVLRNRISEILFRAWWVPFYGFGLLHADAHPGNYSVRLPGVSKLRPTWTDAGQDLDRIELNLFDFGCVRLFRSEFVCAVVELFSALSEDKNDRLPEIYESWGFQQLSFEAIEALNIWARFILAPFLVDRTFRFAFDGHVSNYGREQLMAVRKALSSAGRVRIPRAVVFLDRAAIALGSVFIRLGAESNFHRIFLQVIQEFDPKSLAARQESALKMGGIEWTPE